MTVRPRKFYGLAENLQRFTRFNGSSRHAGSSKCVGSVCLDRCGIAGAIHSVMDECVECVWEGVRCTFPAVSFTQTDDYAREM